VTTETKHTPGPWVVRGEAKYSGFGVNDANGKSVASFPSTMTRGDGEKSANAALIAAAPDMLAALRDALPLLKGHQESPEKAERYQNALAAIAKAEGRA
jgi:hypothetical protein